MLDRFKYWSRFIITYKNWFHLIKNRITNSRPNQIVLRNGYKISGSSDSPLSIAMDEVFILRVYTPTYMQINHNDIVVDIGANIGDFSFLATLLGAKKVFAYEPDTTPFKDLKYNITTNRISNIKAINKAISNIKGSIIFYKAENNGGSSLYKSKTTVLPSKVETIRLSDIFNENKIKKIDFLKIDCEGGEGLIFESTQQSTWNKIGKISMEYHDNISLYNHHQITKLLKKYGFNVSQNKTGLGFGYIYAWK